MNTLFRHIIFILLSLLLSLPLWGQDPVKQKDYPYGTDETQEKNLDTRPGRPVENYMGHRYFLSSSGFGMKKGDVNYQNIGIGISVLNIGVSNNFSIDVGMVPIFLFGGGPIGLSVHPKVSLPITKHIHLGIGAFYGSFIDPDGSNSVGLGYGTLTFGSVDKNISLGIGYGFKNFDFSTTLTAAATYKISPRSYLITEIFHLNQDYGFNNSIVLLGGRTILRRIAIDYGAALYIEKGGTGFRVFPLPWLGATFPLGKKGRERQ